MKRALLLCLIPFVWALGVFWLPSIWWRVGKAYWWESRLPLPNNGPGVEVDH